MTEEKVIISLSDLLVQNIGITDPTPYLESITRLDIGDRVGWTDYIEAKGYI